jgi:hypothetical protein
MPLTSGVGHPRHRWLQWRVVIVRATAFGQPQPPPIPLEPSPLPPMQAAQPGEAAGACAAPDANGNDFH